jgi:electron transfer flavoprotein alpha subunit
VSTLVVLPVVEGQAPAAGAELLGAAQSVGEPVDALVVGAGAGGVASGLAARRAFVADDASLSPYLAETWLPVVEEAIKRAEATLVLFPHSLLTRELAPRVAFRLGAGLVTDCVNLKREDGAVVFTKPVYGGSALADYAVESTPAIATLRPRAFAESSAGGSPQETVEVPVAAGESRAKVVDTVRAAASSGPTLKDAKVVVSGGRGLGGPDNWHYVEELAAALGGAVGASRAVTDAGWAAPSLQVGLTGTTVNPDLYVAVGISGAVQHMAGCSGSRNLAAINRDPDANVFKHARWGVVGDYKEVLPALTARIKELRGVG